jgi:hypothetical protein
MQPEGLLPNLKKDQPLSAVSSQINPAHTLLSYYLRSICSITLPFEPVFRMDFLSISPTRPRYRCSLLPLGAT